MPNLAELPRLKMSWTCLVCRCTEATEPKRKCRVIPRTAEERSLFHANGPQADVILQLAAQGRPDHLGQLTTYATTLAKLVYEHFTTAYDDVICEHCDPEKQR